MKEITVFQAIAIGWMLCICIIGGILIAKLDRIGTNLDRVAVVFDTISGPTT